MTIVTPTTKLEEVDDKDLVYDYGYYEKQHLRNLTEMMRRLKDSLNRLSDETSNYSKRLIILTWILIVIGAITSLIMIIQLFL